MKTIHQYKIAKWLGVKGPTLSNWFCENKGISKDSVKLLKEKTGLSADEILFSDGNELREKITHSYREAHGLLEKECA
jgi:predicted transcriptional regulator